LGETPLSNISNELKAQVFAQESTDPFLTLVTISNPSFTFRLVNNSRDITSNGNVFSSFPMKIRTPVDDGETSKDFSIDFDNVSLDLIESLRSVVGDINVKIELILASMPNVIQVSHDDLLIRSISYNAKSISAKIVLDSFLAIQMTSERYTPSNFPGMFE
jgi:hypothetical protein